MNGVHNIYYKMLSPILVFILLNLDLIKNAMRVNHNLVLLLNMLNIILTKFYEYYYC